MTGDVYTWPEITGHVLGTARKRNGALAKAMPPVVMSYLYHVFSGGGWPVRREGGSWWIETPLQRIELQVIDPHSARLRAWSKKANPGLDAPAIDRMIACRRKEAQDERDG